jgi:DNA-binding transcriptional MerR regulator
MFKIGEFSRLSRVSVRMLRYYDQLGLLKPSQTDRLTSYRYYSADQLPRLNRILALQDLGFTLQQIGGLLDEDLPVEELRGMLKLKRAEVEQGIQAEQARLARLEARIRQMEGVAAGTAYDVIVRSVEPELVATQRAVVSDDERIQYMFHEVEAYVEDHDEARADKPPFTVYHDAEYREHDIDAEVAVPIKFAIPGSESIRVRELPGLAQAACVVHTGHYGTLYQAYNALLGWIEANDFRMAGPMREVYLRYGADGLGFDLPPTYVAAEADEYVTELQLAVVQG